MCSHERPGPEKYGNERQRKRGVSFPVFQGVETRAVFSFPVFQPFFIGEETRGNCPFPLRHCFDVLVSRFPTIGGKRETKPGKGGVRHA